MARSNSNAEAKGSGTKKGSTNGHTTRKRNRVPEPSESESGPSSKKVKQYEETIFVLKGNPRDIRRLSTRCSPPKVIKANKELTPDQRKKLDEIGFGAFSDIKFDNTCATLGAWMLLHFDKEDMCFNFGCAGSVPVNKKSLARLTGLPNTGNKIVPNGCNQNRILSFKQKLGIPTGKKGFPASNLISEIKKGKNDDLFVTCWILLLSDKILAPDTLIDVSPKLLHVCEDVHNIESYDWVGYILEDIRKSATFIQNKMNTIMQDKMNKSQGSCFMKGSTYLLGLYLLDWLKHARKVEACNEQPRFKFWDAYDEVKQILKDHCMGYGFYGKLKLKNVNETCYAPDFDGTNLSAELKLQLLNKLEDPATANSPNMLQTIGQIKSLLKDLEDQSKNNLQNRRRVNDIMASGNLCEHYNDSIVELTE